MTKAQARFLKWVYLAYTLGWHLMLTAEFGWNFAPNSMAELLVDFQAAVNVGICCWMWRYSISKPKKDGEENELHL